MAVQKIVADVDDMLLLPNVFASGIPHVGGGPVLSNVDIHPLCEKELTPPPGQLD